MHSPIAETERWALWKSLREGMTCGTMAVAIVEGGSQSGEVKSAGWVSPRKKGFCGTMGQRESGYCVRSCEGSGACL